MKKQKLLKTLLVAAGLFTGVSASWAGTTTLYSQDYQSLDATDWTSPSYQAGLSLATTGTNIYNKFAPGNQNNRNAYCWFANSLDFTSYPEYSFSVKFCIGALPSGDSKTNLSEWAITGQNSSYTQNAAHSSTSNYYLVLAQKTYGSAEYTVQVGSTTLDDAITLTVGTWYTITQTISENSVTTVITDGSTPVLNNVNAVGYSTIGHLKGINVLGGRYNGQQYVDDILITAEVNEEIVSTPSIAVAYNGANRTVTITPGESSESNAVTTYYTTDGNDPTSSDNVYSAPFDVDADCTVKAITIANSSSVASTIVSEDVTVGKLKLVTPTFAKTIYANGKYTVSMTSDQSGLAFPPASTTLYYSIDGGDAVAYSAAFELSAGSSVTGYAASSNYTNSDEASLASAVRPTFTEAWSQDYTQITKDAGTGAQTITLASESFTAGERNFYNIIKYADTSVDLDTHVGLNTATGFSLRCYGNNSGILKNSNSGGSTGYIGFQNLTVGQYLVLTTNGNSLSAEAGVELQEGMSTTSEYVFKITATSASIFFPHGTYNYVKTIGAYNASVSIEISAAGMATYVPAYDLDFTGTDIAAYTAEVTAKGVCTLTEIKKVPAGTPVLLIGTTDDIPVVATTDAVGTNNLVAGTGAKVATEDGGYTNMILNNIGGKVGFYLANDQTVAANRAYLHFDSSKAPAGSRMTLLFGEGETTGISEKVTVNSEKIATAPVYNLNGQRVAQPTRGLYIVNGKKVVVK